MRKHARNPQPRAGSTNSSFLLFFSPLGRGSGEDVGEGQTVCGAGCLASLPRQAAPKGTVVTPLMVVTLRRIIEFLSQSIGLPP